jgi:asparagine synthase (glutamine-hydrolysing)
MVRTLHHRGPDGTGFYVTPDVGLGHARLSIIDLAGGHQPIHNEDESVWVVFNGEIFNYVELRADLEKLGHRFYTHSDTEVIVHLYEQYGDEFPQHLNGQFAIALWDQPRRRLVLVRDRAGILPLFYTEHERTLMFASEVKSLLAGIGRAPMLNPRALDQLMTFWSPVSPETMFEGVFEVSPGEMIVAQDSTLTKRRYWDWAFPEDGQYRSGTDDQLAGELHDLLVDATRLRLRADVPVGAYLSGGLDSSVLVSLIHHYGGVKLRTFSIGFEDDALDESSYQRQMIEHLGAEHSNVFCRTADVGQHFIETIWHTESPVLRTAPVPMGILSGLVREQGYKVVLTGEGSDEVLGGYDIFKEAKVRQFWARNPQSKWRPLLLKKLYPYLDLSKSQGLVYLQNFFGTGLSAPDQSCFSHLPRWETTAKCKEFFSEDLKSRLNSDAMNVITSSLPAALRVWAPFNRSQYIEAKSLMAGYLLCSQGDRMLMKNSVEGRFPFLDHRVIEFANGLKPSLKMKVLNEKYLLKRAMAKYLPASIVARYKQPYRAPDIPAFFGNVDSKPEYVRQLMSPDKVREYGYFDADKVGRLVNKIDAGRAMSVKDNMALVGILSTQVWHHLFVENFSRNIASK